MRGTSYYILSMLLFLIAFSSMASVNAVETVYRVIDGDGLDVVIGTPPSEGVPDLVDVIETWLEVDGGSVYAYIKLDSSSFVDVEETRYSLRYIVGSKLISNNILKNVSIELAIEPGRDAVVCRIDSDDEVTENLGMYEITGLDKVVLKLTCNFEGEVFTSPPDVNKLFRVVAALSPASIDLGTFSASDIVSFGAGATDEQPDDSPTVPSPEDNVKEDVEDVEEQGFDLTLVYVLLGLVAAGGVAFYLLKMKG